MGSRIIPLLGLGEVPRMQAMVALACHAAKDADCPSLQRIFESLVIFGIVLATLGCR